ncbi:hypothetical protein AFLA_002121 [Aspergillus flavus NRRL3357]|nr:hypothetical protein AFLA_002121 [Aspergillus flavus NRRL3357]
MVDGGLRQLYIALALLLNHSSNFHLSFLCSINPAHNIVCELASWRIFLVSFGSWKARGFIKAHLLLVFIFRWFCIRFM